MFKIQISMQQWKAMKCYFFNMDWTSERHECEQETDTNVEIVMSIYCMRHGNWHIMYISVKLSLYWCDPSPEKGQLGVLHLWLLKKTARRNIFNFGPKKLVRILIRHIQAHRRKLQAAAAFRDYNLRVLKICHHWNHQPCSKAAFCKKACQKNVLAFG